MDLQLPKIKFSVQSPKLEGHEVTAKKPNERVKGNAKTLAKINGKTTVS